MHRPGIQKYKQHAGNTGESVTLQWTEQAHKQSPQTSASLVYSPTLYCLPGMKETEQDATVPGSNQPRQLSWKSVKLYQTVISGRPSTQ